MEFPPLSATRLRLAMLSIGITEDDMDAAISGNPEGMIMWKHAAVYDRDHPLFDGLATQFGITPEQIDALWQWAAT